MKPLILFAFLVSALSSNATEWRSVSATNDVGTLFFVDVDSIKDDGRHVVAWTKENRKSPKQVMFNGKSVSYMSYIALRVFDCQQQRSAIVQGTFYSKANGKGESLYSFNEKLTNDLFSFVTPSSMGEAMLQFACEKQSPHKIQT